MYKLWLSVFLLSIEFVQMSWVADGVMMLMESSEDKSYFECSVPKENQEKLEDAWSKQLQDQETKYVYSIGNKHDNVEELSPFSHLCIDHEEYYLSIPRSLCGTNPIELDVFSVKKMLHEKRVLVYTGAGISKAAGIPLMRELETMFSLSQVFTNPEYVLEKVSEFRKSCFRAKPTVAHYAIAELIELVNGTLLTENLDQLHEISGLEVTRPHVGRLKEGKGIDFKVVDFMIIAGMSKDNRGVIAWYKEQNPMGKIIAVNFGKPSYLGNEDYLLEGDVQTVMPMLVNQLR